MVVPRLHFTDEDGPSAPSPSSKRKLPFRPPPQLFNPAKCVQDELIRHKRDHVYSYRSWRFEYGLQVKVFNSISLCPAREIPPSICRLFMDAKSLAGAGHLIEMSSMPLPSFWKFEPGEKVLVHSDEGQRFGTVILSIPKGPRSDPACEVDIEGERWPILIRNLEKEIILGQYIEVLAGVHVGKKGFVVGKCDTLLGICIGHDTNGLDFRVHANSVKLAVPDYSHTKVPWLNVEVTLVSGPHIGSTGFIKDVAVNSTRSLSITVSLSNKQECVVGHHAVRERSTRRLLMDHQPLQRHQQQFNVEVPWKDVEVTIQSGRFMNCSAIVKNVRRDFRGGLRLSLWVPRYRCSIDIDHAAVCERHTRAPLITYRPLEGHQLKEFSISSSIETMRTGPVPWLGFLVKFVHGDYKGQYGLVKDVNRYPVAPSLRGKRSGLILTVERRVFTVTPSSQLVKVDYDALRFSDSKKRLCEVFLPTARQSFYLPDEQYQCQLDDSDFSDSHEQLTDGDYALPTPFVNDLEQEVLFYAASNSSSLIPGRDASFPQTPGHVTPNPVSQTGVSRSPLPWTPASPSLRSPSPEPPPPPPPDHWLLNPKLLGIPIKVDIRGGGLDTLNKKDGIFVESTASENGISIIHRATPSKMIQVPLISVICFRSQAKPATEKGLMVVARNRPEHIGKLVRRVHHFYEKEKTEDHHCLVMITVDRSGHKESKGHELLDMHPDDLEFVKESAEERKWSTELLREVRAEFSYSPVDIRPRRA
ncbi:hypothetical protein F5878DRAFT_634028 [Lentinula raphanica]|uniref:Chromatin elongation factor spt5 n=1 Tax=Lentinula raphanica TaxID=153919 RepID=A0AA38U5S9_9AGAR|nr:hypothetical protein F5878DRAFT_634028 [Lentinula raphanica]